MPSSPANLPLGKLPPDRLAQLLQIFARPDPAVVLGPGVGRDCAVLDLGGDLRLVAKSDPITFATAEIGWYAVHVNANDVATTGAVPRWFLATLLLPQTMMPEEIDRLFEQLQAACAEIAVMVIGGHTEVTYDLARPIVLGTLLGTVPADRLVTPAGARPGDVLILTKRLAVEATALIAREKAAELRGHFDADFLRHCEAFLRAPGISVLRDAQIACAAGGVHAMHDPTEGGLAMALWELALAAQVDLAVDVAGVPVYAETQALCAHFALDVWGVIASGSLLLAVEPAHADRVVAALQAHHIEATPVGQVVAQSDRPSVWSRQMGRNELLRRFERDEITRLF